MGRRRTARPRTSAYKATPLSYKMGATRRNRAGSYRAIYLQGQLEQVQNYMNMASQELGNDYNLEIHRLGMLQDEMARLDDMIAGWHDTEAGAAGKREEGWRKDRDDSFRRDQLAQKISTERTDNKLNARKAASSDADLPESTKSSIASIATGAHPSTSMVDFTNSVITDGQMAGLASLPHKLQRQQAAVALNDSLMAKMGGIPLAPGETTGGRRATALATASKLTGIPENEITASGFSAARSAHIAEFERKYSYAGKVGSTAGMTPQEKQAALESQEKQQKQASDILKKWMARRDMLAEQLDGGMPSAPTYEDARSRANEMYQPITPREAREGHKERTQQDEALRASIQSMPKDQRILMQAARRGQRFADGDTDAVFGPGHKERGNSGLAESELMAAGFIKEQLKNGTLSMSDVIPYATRIAEAEGLDDSAKVVSSRDRILADAMGALMGDYRNTLPANDLKRSPDIPSPDLQKQSPEPQEVLGDIDLNDFPESP